MERGFTLLEAVTALALWMVLTVGVLFLWQFTAKSSSEMIAGQSALENARIAMDLLVMNVQLADEVELRITRDGTLRSLRTYQLDPDYWRESYVFTFDPFTPQAEARRNMLLFGNNEAAREIQWIWIVPAEKLHFDITIRTTGDPPLTLTGSVDIRYKKVDVIYVN